MTFNEEERETETNNDIRNYSFSRGHSMNGTNYVHVA